ncbi:hypothetical protein F53441_13060 [Fusarium austroafricanum]|uniref:Uncharacterized protein n=1 Tax=Fusarium austroafricanum TaxID=2364996 RepID=A0A8H4JUQ1_9HYPO|nr:hypothetical protein F53441_13060 [Fusarium austroafricanum]
MGLHPTPSALIVSWDANPPLGRFRTVLQEYFGYDTIPLRLPKQNCEQVLKRELANALISHSGMNNPFILYCYGDSLMRQGQSRLLLTRSDRSVFVDWLKLRQEHLDKFDSNVLVILDCNHKVMQTAVNRYPILEDDMASRSKSIVQILVAPKFSHQDATPFPYVLANTLKAVAESSASGPIDIRYLVAEISRRSGPEYYAELYSLRPDQEDLKLQVCSYERQDSFVDTWYDPWVANNASKYLRVSVLPITWAEVDRWDAEAELKELLDVFEDHFDLMIESIVKIPNASSAQSSLQARIDEQIDKVGPRGLLIVVYNGHARRTDGGMILFGRSSDGQSVNWTEVTHTLNVANCDVVHVLDCCDALSATKGIEAEKQTQVDMARAADLKTNDSEFQGINETLAAGAREERVPAGPDSSMKVFAMVLREMAVQKIPISIHSWQQHIIAKSTVLTPSNMPIPHPVAETPNFLYPPAPHLPRFY